MLKDLLDHVLRQEPRVRGARHLLSGQTTLAGTGIFNPGDG